MRRWVSTWTLIAVGCLPAIATAQEIELAKSFYNHHLTDKAKESLILVLNNAKASDGDKAEALYLLGNLSFEEKRYKIAFLDWEELLKRFPQSPQGKEISARLNQLREVTSQAVDAKISSAVASSYLSNGDFWSHSDHKYTIDSSWLPSVELAVEWYDRVIAEFPESYAAEVAYQRKLFALFGWGERGKYSEVYGAKADPAKYLPLILETFEKFQQSFPTSSSLQGFRYLIAQQYWGQKNWAKTREWLQHVIDSANGDKTFFAETARARLKKVEY